MKSALVFLAAGLVFMQACTKTSSSNPSDSIGGDGNLDANVVGYDYGCYSDIAGLTATEAKVISNNNGVVTISLKGKLPTTGNTLTNLIPAAYKDASGNVSVTGTFKNTTEGILDYTNSDGKPFVLVRYSSNVGDKYVLNKSNGQTITRTVTAKSTTDDYPWGFMYIKTITVEQDSRIPGISKIRYIANHKFGLVGIQFVMEDGSTSKLTIM